MRMAIFATLLIIAATGWAQPESSAAKCGYVSEEAAQYAEAAQFLICECLPYLAPGLTSPTTQMDTIFVAYPVSQDERPSDPPQEFLDGLYSNYIVFAPYSQKPAGRWDNYLAVSISRKGTDDSVKMSMTIDCSSILGRRFSRRGEKVNFALPIQRGATAVLVRKHGVWEIVQWTRAMML
jgi:hypothetical protein